MNTNQAHTLASIRNVEGFLDQHADLFATKIKPAFRTRLTTALTALSATIAEQESLTRKVKGSSKDRAALRTVLLHEHMAPIARIAQIELPTNPAIGQFHMPKGRTSTERLAAAASGMAQAALPFHDVFVAEALPDDFITQLTEARDLMIAASTQRASHSSGRKGATSGLRSQLKEARVIIHAMDAIVRPVIKGDATLLATWKSISHVQRSRTSTAAVSTPAPVIAPVATPATVPTLVTVAPTPQGTPVATTPHAAPATTAAPLAAAA